MLVIAGAKELPSELVVAGTKELPSELRAGAYKLPSELRAGTKELPSELSGGSVTGPRSATPALLIRIQRDRLDSSDSSLRFRIKSLSTTEAITMG